MGVGVVLALVAMLVAFTGGSGPGGEEETAGRPGRGPTPSARAELPQVMGGLGSAAAGPGPSEGAGGGGAPDAPGVTVPPPPPPSLPPPPPPPPEPVVNADHPDCAGCPIAPLTGLPTPGDQLDRPALAVKIDNHDSGARPQTGLNEADIVFEERVEGDITRFIAVFHSKGSDPVGPIRSARTTDLYVLPMFHQPLLAWSGGNDGVRQAVANAPVVDVGGNAVPSAYARQGTHEAPSNLFSNTQSLWGAAGGRGGRPTPIFSYRAAGEPPANAQPVSGVRLGFTTPVDFRWDGTAWLRIQAESTHVDGRGTPVRPSNVVVLFTPYRASPADGNSPETQLLGSDRAWVFTSGTVVEGSWTRGSPDSPPRLTDTTGAEIRLTPGRTYVELVEGATIL